MKRHGGAEGCGVGSEEGGGERGGREGDGCGEGAGRRSKGSGEEGRRDGGIHQLALRRRGEEKKDRRQGENSVRRGQAFGKGE